MNRTTSGDAKGKAERQQTILRLIQEHPISRQEVLLEHLREEGFAVTQATISRDIRELCLVKAATSDGYRYVSSHNESLNPKMQGRFETIFHESVLGVDYAGHVVLVKCFVLLPYPFLVSAARCGGSAHCRWFWHPVRNAPQ